MKLFYKISIIILVGSLITISSVSFFVFTSTKSTIETNIKEKQNELGRQVISQVDRLLFNYYVGIQNIAEEETIERTLGGELTDARVIQRRIKELPFLTGPWDELQIVNHNGVVVASNNEKKIGKMATEDGDLNEIKAQDEAFRGHVYYSDSVISSDTGRVTVIFSSPVRDQEKPNQPIVGVVLGEMAFPVVSELLSGLKQIGHIELYKSDGILIAKDEGNTKNLLTKNDTVSKATQAPSPVVDDFMGAPNTLSTLSISKGYFDYKGNKWSLLIEVPTDVVFAPSQNTTKNIIVFLLPIILLTMIIVLVLLNLYIIRPVTYFTKITEIIAGGDLKKRVEVRSKDEIGELAVAFNVMTEKLQELYNSLDNKVKDKTQELSTKITELEESKSAILNILADSEKDKKYIAKEKDKMDAILHSIGDGVFVVDESGKVLLINKVAADMTGYKMEELLDTKYSEKIKFIFEDTGKINDQFINKAIETRTIQEMSNHTILVNKNGSKIQVADSAAPLLDAGGKITGCVVVFRDVTKEHQIDKAKTEFVSLASHQLRTPLSAINWYTEMLLAGDAGKVNKEQKKYLEEVSGGSKRMVELVNALLNVSRLELGTFIVEPEPTNVIEIAKSVIEELKPQIIEKKLKLEETYSENIPNFQADKKLLRIVFQNLLSNSVKYTKNGGLIKIELAVTLRGQNFGGKDIKEDSITIKICDNGMGIPTNQEDKIFSKLFRADNARKSDTEGTGLGLYIIKSIVEHSEGSIWFDSEENKGSTFYAVFPLSGMKKKEGTKKLD